MQKKVVFDAEKNSPCDTEARKILAETEKITQKQKKILETEKNTRSKRKKIPETGKIPFRIQSDKNQRGGTSPNRMHCLHDNEKEGLCTDCPLAATDFVVLN